MFWNNSNQVNETSRQQSKDDGNLKTTLYSGIFGNIAVLAFLANLLLCFVICRRRDLPFQALQHFDSESHSYRFIDRFE